ncbi:unnamed protein product, partial [Hymenolepis diminuta]|uniref:DUF3453 domain-containing protein n=1 Tax=Hymenolepis diminuta TaxID=6216 RepID=A0A158QFS4_HYMDI
DVVDVEICEENVPRLCEGVWSNQVSHRLIEQINAEIEGLLERVLSAPPNDSSGNLNSISGIFCRSRVYCNCQIYVFHGIAFTMEITICASEASCSIIKNPGRQLPEIHTAKMLLTLPGETILTLLRNRLLSPNLAASGGFNLRILLSLISTIVVCCRRGISLITNFLHDILLSIFSSMPTKISQDSSSHPPDLAALLDDSISSMVSQSQNATNNAVDPVELKFIQFYHVLIIVRQVCVEDNRLTAFSYGQWWRENFSTSPVPQKEGSGVGGVLATRRSLELLSNLLIRLLPFERSPIHLSAQLATSAPFWATTKQKGESEEEECCRAWNVYLDVARGRLAELRMERVNEAPEPPVNSIGWPSEVEALVEDFMKMNNNAGGPEVKRLPSSLVEMHLFRSGLLSSYCSKVDKGDHVDKMRVNTVRANECPDGVQNGDHQNFCNDGWR